MDIAIAGGTGLVGQDLTEYLINNGHRVYILTRDTSNKENTEQIKYVEWLTGSATPEVELHSVDAFVNLAGESINSGRWTEERKHRILESRIASTKEIVRIMSEMVNKPSVLINASAIGYYGTSESAVFTENDKKAGNDFLASTVSQWEEEALHAESHGIRTVLTRFGIILDKQEGALPRMILPYKFFAGGPVGSGQQWMSWIHIKDVVHIIDYCIQNKNIQGAVNVTAPHPKKMNEFGKTIGKVMNRPHWIPAPSFALKMALGEMSDLVLKGQKVMPAKLERSGFEFSFTQLEDALNDILK
ncbi:MULTISPECIES: TIGR01777 family oxidoreductase [Bacillus]|uniref:TIGR01777 family oxidoreductase n=1 Tax=Bacillus TaxID=1386 RepID=UPI000BB9210A|nr:MULTISPECIES: TIGR01777 family oxidoreductase [Bacillus]